MHLSTKSLLTILLALNAADARPQLGLSNRQNGAGNAGGLQPLGNFESGDTGGLKPLPGAEGSSFSSFSS